MNRGNGRYYETETTSAIVEGRAELPLAAVLLIGAAYGVAVGLALALAVLFNAPLRAWAGHFPGELPVLQGFLVATGALAGACAATLITMRREA